MAETATGAEGVEIRRIDPLSEDGRSLFARLSQEQIDRYGRDGGRKLEDLAGDDVFFIAAYLDGRPMGCGAVVPFEGDTGEISRLFVDPAARRRGLGRAVMAGLEDHARTRYARLKLETGTEQPESVALYESHGYRPIPCWGASADNPRSRCYEKVLAPSSRASSPR